MNQDLERGNVPTSDTVSGERDVLILRRRPPHPVANPDDLPVQRPPEGPHGPRPGPFFLGLPGRAAIAEGQVFIVAFIVVAQLWLITDTLYEALSGRAQNLGWLTLASAAGFVIALVVWLWPRRRLLES